MEKIKIQYLNDEIERLRYIDGKSDWIDLRAAEDVEMKAGEFRLIPLGVAMQLPRGYEAHIVPRSSTFKNFGIIQTNHMGIIDESYCGPNDWFYMPAYALRDTVIGGNLYISEGVDLGQVTLENVTVLGEIVVSGGGVSEGGDDSIILRNVDASKLVVDNLSGQQVSLRVEGAGKIAETDVRTDAYIADRTSEGYGLAKIVLDGDADEKLELTLDGNIKEVVNTAPDSALNLASGTAQTITVDDRG